MRKIVSTIFIFILMTSTVLGSGEPMSKWAESEISVAIEKNIFPLDMGYAYKEGISRQEFCKIVVYNYLVKKGYENIDSFLEADMPDVLDRYRVFEDVDYESEDGKYILAAYFLEISDGTSATKFSPQMLLNREQAATLAHRFYLKLVSKYINLDKGAEETRYSDDLEISYWAKNSVYKLRHYGIMRGVGENIYAPKLVYTKEQAIVTMLRTVLFLEEQERARLRTEKRLETELSEIEMEVFNLVNKERESRGLKALTIAYHLIPHARGRAKEIIVKFAHERPDGSSCFSGIKNFRNLGENIAAGQVSAESVMRDWMNSPSHRENILNNSFEQIVVTHEYDRNSNYGDFWVQVFYTK